TSRSAPSSNGFLFQLLASVNARYRGRSPSVELEVWQSPIGVEPSSTARVLSAARVTPDAPPGLAAVFGLRCSGVAFYPEVPQSSGADRRILLKSASLSATITSSSEQGCGSSDLQSAMPPFHVPCPIKCRSCEIVISPLSKRTEYRSP